VVPCSPAILWGASIRVQVRSLRCRPEPAGSGLSRVYLPLSTPFASGLQGSTPRSSSRATPNSSPPAVRSSNEYSTGATLRLPDDDTAADLPEIAIASAPPGRPSLPA
jgi:hypothetical protein